MTFWLIMLLGLAVLGAGSLSKHLSRFGAHLQGVHLTEDGNQDERPLFWKEQLLWLDPERTMFTQMLMRIPQVRVKSCEFKLFERNYPDRWVKVNDATDLNSSDTALVLDDSSPLKAGHVLRVPRTNELLLVTANDTGTNTATVTRGYLSSSAAAIYDNEMLKILFEEQQENGSSGTPISTVSTTVTNYTQILKVPYGISNTNKVEARRTGTTVLATERMLALSRLKEELEDMIKWGKKSESVSGSTIKRYSGGVNNFVTTNRIDCEGGIGMGDIPYLVNESTRFGGKKKIWFAGRDARMQLDTLGLDMVRLKQDENILGMAVDGVRSSNGEFILVTDHSLENGDADKIFIIDPSHIQLAVLRPINHEANIENNDVDGEKHQFIAELGLYISQEKAHTILTNTTTILRS